MMSPLVFMQQHIEWRLRGSQIRECYVGNGSISPVHSTVTNDRSQSVPDRGSPSASGGSWIATQRVFVFGTRRRRSSSPASMRTGRPPRAIRPALLRTTPVRVLRAKRLAEPEVGRVGVGGHEPRHRAIDRCQQLRPWVRLVALGVVRCEPARHRFQFVERSR